MFKKTLLSAAVISLASLTGVAQAEQVNGYLFASVGQSEADVSKRALDNDLGLLPDERSSLDKKDTAYKIGAGIQLNPYVGVEFQYLDLGEVVYKLDGPDFNARIRAETKGLGINAVGTLPLDRFGLFAKVGYHQLKTDAKAVLSSSFFTDRASDSEKEWVWSWGVGASLMLTESFSLVAEFERYRDVADDFDVDLISAGLRYNF